MTSMPWWRSCRRPWTGTRTCGRPARCRRTASSTPSRRTRSGPAMGLLSELLLLPLAPARLALWTIDRVIDVASREYNDPTAVRRALVELNRQLDAGLISDEDFDRQED